MVPRQEERRIHARARLFPAGPVLGHRQRGQTTLARRAGWGRNFDPAKPSDHQGSEVDARIAVRPVARGLTGRAGAS